MKSKNEKIFSLILLLIIILGAFVVRFYNIDNAPSGIYPDEAENGFDALNALQNNDYKLFYTGNNGREGLFINLISLSVRFLNTSMLSLKLPSIIFGTLTVLGVYLLTKELFRSRRAGIIAAFFTAFSFWSINFSRIAFRAVMLPTILTFSFYYLFCGIRYNKIIYNIKNKKFWTTSIFKSYLCFAAAGLIFGIGLHTYISFRIAPFILLLSFIALWITKKHFWRDYWKQSLIFIFTAFVTMAPLLWDFYQHPEYFSSRSGSISIFSPEMNQGHIIKTFFRSLGLSLVKYNFWGDQNWRHNYPPYPILNPILGFTFLIGLVYLIIKWFHLLFLRIKHKIRDRKFYVYTFILAWFFTMLAPEFLTAEGLPHALRSIGTLPVTFIIATVPFLWLLGKRDKFGYGFKFFVNSFLIITIPFIGIFEIIKYHYFWTNNVNQYISFDRYLKEISDYSNTLPKDTEKYIIADQYTTLPLRFLNSNDENIYFVWDVHVLFIEPTNNNFVIFETHPKKEIKEQILTKFPNIKETQHNKDGGGYFSEFTYTDNQIDSNINY